MLKRALAVGMLCCTLLGAAWADKNEFTTLARANFPAWDLNHDVHLDQDELERMMVDPSVKGDDAVCLACLEHFKAVQQALSARGATARQAR